MSVDLNIRYREGVSDDEIFIAGTLDFYEYYLEPAKNLGLELIPLLGSLITSDKTAIVELLSDLITLRDYLNNNAEIDQDSIQVVLTRMQAAIQAFERALNNWDKVSYISCG